MKLVGIYRGKFYIIGSDSNRQGVCQYRDVNPSIGYNNNGFTFPLNSLNIDLVNAEIEPLFKDMPSIFKGTLAITVNLNNEITVQSRWHDPIENKLVVREHQHGTLEVAINQWYSNENTIVMPFVAVLKQCKPKVIDAEFINKLRFIEEMHETVKIYSIELADFVKTIHQYQAGRSALDILKDWNLEQVTSPVTCNDINVMDLPVFNVSETVYWNSWYKSSETVTEETKVKKPKLVEPLPENKDVA